MGSVAQEGDNNRGATGGQQGAGVIGSTSTRKKLLVAEASREKNENKNMCGHVVN